MPSVDTFLRLLRRKIRLLGAITAAFAVVAIVALIMSRSHPGLAPIAGAACIIGAASAVLAVDGSHSAHRIEDLISRGGRNLELNAWGVSNAKNPTRRPTGILATLDEIGSDDPKPRFEVKSRWFTPGITDQPAREAIVFGQLELGALVLAVGNNGGVLGRVTAAPRYRDKAAAGPAAGG